MRGVRQLITGAVMSLLTATQRRLAHGTACDGPSYSRYSHSESTLINNENDVVYIETSRYTYTAAKLLQVPSSLSAASLDGIGYSGGRSSPNYYMSRKFAVRRVCDFRDSTSLRIMDIELLSTVNISIYTIQYTR
jgi:hypothetical protein